MSGAVQKRTLRSSPRSNTYGEVTTQQLYGMGDPAVMNIFCMEVDNSDGTTFYFTQTALFSSSASGTIALVAGHEHDDGFEDGSRSEARFRFPSAMALYQEERCMYVCDCLNNALRRVGLQTGETTTVGADNITFIKPNGIAIDGKGVLYISDQGHHPLRVPGGVVGEGLWPTRGPLVGEGLWPTRGPPLRVPGGVVGGRGAHFSTHDCRYTRNCPLGSISSYWAWL